MTRSTWTDAADADLCRHLATAPTLALAAAQIGRTVGAVAGRLATLRGRRDTRVPARWMNTQRRHSGWRAVDATITDLPPIVSRDPCFRCGVRRDVGCVHTAHERDPSLVGNATVML